MYAVSKAMTMIVVCDNNFLKLFKTVQNYFKKATKKETNKIIAFH